MKISKESRLAWFRVLLGVLGLMVVVAIVQRVGFSVVLETMRSGIAWLPFMAAVELMRIGCATVASRLAFGPLASKIPLPTLFRAHVIGHCLGSVAPAPSVVNETIKATLFAPYTGSGPAAAVGFTNQAAVLVAGGLFSIPCGIAVLILKGTTVWFWACVIHAVTLVSCGIGLQAITRAGAVGRFLTRRSPALSERAAAFHDHARGIKLGAAGPTVALFFSRAFQLVQWWLGARALGIDVTFLRVMAMQGVNLVATAVGVFVPAGMGAIEGAFALAAEMLDTSVAKMASLALLGRCSQIIWVLIASIVALTTKTPRVEVEDAPSN